MSIYGMEFVSNVDNSSVLGSDVVMYLNKWVLTHNIKHYIVKLENLGVGDTMVIPAYDMCKTMDIKRIK
jgi:hypothetical protein